MGGNAVATPFVTVRNLTLSMQFLRMFTSRLEFGYQWLEHEIIGYQALHYTYINDERLKQVSDGTNIYKPAYDALGRRVTAPTAFQNGATVYYFDDGENPS